jgi:hypothetical protein
MCHSSGCTCDGREWLPVRVCFVQKVGAAYRKAIAAPASRMRDAHRRGSKHRHIESDGDIDYFERIPLCEGHKRNNLTVKFKKMRIFGKIRKLSDSVSSLNKSVRLFIRDPFLWAGVASLSTVMGCAYGEPPLACYTDERDCLDNYMIICGSVDGEKTGWYATECEIGCQDGKCIDGKIVNGTAVNCEAGTERCEGGEKQRCQYGIWISEGKCPNGDQNDGQELAMGCRFGRPYARCCSLWASLRGPYTRRSRYGLPFLAAHTLDLKIAGLNDCTNILPNFRTTCICRARGTLNSEFW